MKMAQILKDKTGKPAFAILDYADFERLLAAAEYAEDAQAVRAALADGGEVTPLELTERIVAGESPVRVWRERRELTQSDLTAKAGVTQSYIAGIEAGKRAGSVKALRAIADALGTDLDEIVATRGAADISTRPIRNGDDSHVGAGRVSEKRRTGGSAA